MWMMIVCLALIQCSWTSTVSTNLDRKKKIHSAHFLEYSVWWKATGSARPSLPSECPKPTFNLLCYCRERETDRHTTPCRWVLAHCSSPLDGLPTRGPVHSPDHFDPAPALLFKLRFEEGLKKRISCCSPALSFAGVTSDSGTESTAKVTERS